MIVETQDDKATWTIGRLLRWTAEYFERQQLQDARLATEVLLASSLNCARIDLYARFDNVLDESQLASFRDSVRRAADNEPVAYIVQEKEFFSLPFRVTPDVLIPRPETEVLVECVLDHMTRRELVTPNILDLGTGSGCVAVAILHQCKHAVAVATDVSASAIELAKFNADRNGVLDRLTLAQADSLTIPSDIVPAGGFDVLVSNPPYVPAAEMKELAACVRDHEPKIALTDGLEGVSFYQRIAADGSALLKPDGVVIVEVGAGQADGVRDIFKRAGTFMHCETRRDAVVGADRVLKFARSAGT